MEFARAVAVQEHAGSAETTHNLVQWFRKDQIYGCTDALEMGTILDVRDYV
jgi:hypothetical protein